MCALNNSSYPGFVIQFTTIAVDFWPRQGFQHLTHLFLTHAHTDHTKNLDHTWCNQFIYCSQITKKLIIDLKGIKPEYIIELEMTKTHIMKLDANETFNVTLLDANHCPGAVMFLFEGYFGNILATGDFRYSPSMFVDSPLSNQKEIELCYLDNTYLHEYYAAIPTREEAFKEMVKIIETKRADINSICLLKLKYLGKENLLIDLFKHFQKPILVDQTRFNRYTKILSLNEECFTTEPHADTLIAIEDDNLLANENVYKFLSKKYAVYLEPTALHLGPKQSTKPSENFYRIAYTDHSSYRELIEFVRQLRPKKIELIVRKMLPNNVDTTDTKCLDKHLSKLPRLGSVREKYNLLLKSETSVNKAAYLNAFQLNNQSITVKNVSIKLNRIPGEAALNPAITKASLRRRGSLEPAFKPFKTNNVTTRRTRAKPTQIEYETPEKDDSKNKSLAPISRLFKKLQAVKPKLETIKELKSDVSLNTDTEGFIVLDEKPDETGWKKVNDLVEVFNNSSTSSSSDDSFVSFSDNEMQLNIPKKRAEETDSFETMDCASDTGETDKLLNEDDIYKDLRVVSRRSSIIIDHSINNNESETRQPESPIDSALASYLEKKSPDINNEIDRKIDCFYEFMDLRFKSAGVTLNEKESGQLILDYLFDNFQF